MMREKTLVGNFYHIFNRGNDKTEIFRDFEDRRRFVLSLLLAHSAHDVSHLSRKSKNLDISLRQAFEPEFALTLKVKRLVKLNAFALMDNHFHLLVEENSESGISRTMQKLLNSYSKFFNTKYDRAGHLFSGAYKIVPVESNEQLLYLSAYIHRNPRELPGWEGKEHLYPWSSCRDYLDGTDWQGLLEKSTIMDQMENGLTYREVLENSAAKDGSKWSTSDVDHF